MLDGKIEFLPSEPRWQRRQRSVTTLTASAAGAVLRGDEFWLREAKGDWQCPLIN